MYPPKGNHYLPDQSSIPSYPPTGNQYYPPVQPSAPPYPPPTGNQYNAPEQSSAQAYPPSGSQFYLPKQSSAQTNPTPTDQYYPSVQPPAPPPATGIPVHPTGEFYPTAAPGVQVTSTVQFYPTAAPPGQFYPTAAPPGQFYDPAGSAGFRTQPIGHAGWSTGLFGCFEDVGNSIITLFLPCITFGQIAEIVDRGSNSCVTSTVLYTLILYFLGCPCVYSCTYRSKLRAQYSLEESPCSDFLVHCFLEQCALCQEYRELKNRGFDMNIGYRANMERQGHGAIVQPPIQVGMYR